MRLHTSYKKNCPAAPVDEDVSSGGWMNEKHNRREEIQFCQKRKRNVGFAS
jgi:hypothetical protein